MGGCGLWSVDASYNTPVLFRLTKLSFFCFFKNVVVVVVVVVVIIVVVLVVVVVVYGKWVATSVPCCNVIML